MTRSLHLPTIGRSLLSAAMAIAALFVLAATPAAAKPGATINMKDADHPWGCWMSAAASGLSVNLHTKKRIHTIKNPGGLTKLRCQFKIPAAARPKKPIRKSGFACGIYLPGGGVVTKKTRAHSSPGGKATLECIVKQSALNAKAKAKRKRPLRLRRNR